MNTRTLIAIPYEITRAPLALVDTRIVRRLPQDRFPRLAFDRALGSYDQFAGRLLADDALVQHGLDRVARSSKLAEAVVLERDADQRREQAAAVVAAARESAAQKRGAARDRAIDGLDAAEATERRGKQAAASRARATAAQEKKAVRERTEQRTTAIRKNVARSDEAVDARQSAARQAATTKLKDVSATKKTAREARADADKLAALAHAKKNDRKS